MFQKLEKKRSLRFVIIITLLSLLLYGAGRFYYQTTDGFLVSNIYYNHSINPNWDIEPLSQVNKESLNAILDQPFYYLGKGCQSYVFSSKDGEYVIKFFKYQRFRPQEWIGYFSFIPWVENYRLKKIEKKKRKLEGVFTGWKIAYEHLQNETGVIYVHLNKNGGHPKNLTIFDKLGIQHSVDLNQTEFLLQKKAEMLCPTIEALVKNGDDEEVKRILRSLISMFVSENQRGFADNDHALMQNTGILHGQPLHIDVGQLIKNPIMRDPNVYQQELVNKSYKFLLWLKSRYPKLANYYEELLYNEIGARYWEMKPIFYTADMARIPNA